jgi:magnesium transporter
MSDHDEVSLDTGYSTPVPELDDHRYQSSSVQRPRSRRCTVDTMHSMNGQGTPGFNMEAINDGLLNINTRDFEEAVTDEETGGVSPQARYYPDNRSRRGTVTTMDPRSVSPPNSVKAFADARRRERDLSSPMDPTAAIAYAEGRRHDEPALYRTMSGASGRSRRTRRYTNDNGDAKSFASSRKSAEEDVCFPLHDTGKTDNLQIDFESLEDFIADEEIRDKTPPKNQPQARIFQDLRPQQFVEVPQIFLGGDDVVEIPSADSSTMNEKCGKRDFEAQTRPFDGSHQLDTNRFEYFSSLGESTIHAAEFGDLILPGEDIRNLFTFPQGEELDGVWWLNMNNPTDEEIRAICKAFGVHPLTIEDIGTQEAREKIELFPSYYFACFRSFHEVDSGEGQRYQPFNIYVVVFREGTLSFSFSPNRHAAHVRKRITMLKDYVALSSDWICYALM